jgi:threonine aldolase
LAEFIGKEAALCFSSGYQTNLGTISALVSKGDVAITDKDDHASIVWLRLDGLKSDEIAQLLSISPELVRKRHQRAVEKLRQLTT